MTLARADPRRVFERGNAGLPSSDPKAHGYNRAGPRSTFYRAF
jgi:hypothetical protein